MKPSKVAFISIVSVAAAAFVAGKVGIRVRPYS